MHTKCSTVNCDNNVRGHRSKCESCRQVALDKVREGHKKNAYEKR